MSRRKKKRKYSSSGVRKAFRHDTKSMSFKRKKSTKCTTAINRI